MANAKIKTSELTIKDSPSTSATLVGVDNGETVQIPISALGSSGGGIVVVDALPVEGEADTIYKVYEVAEVKMVSFIGNDYDGFKPTVEGASGEAVDELPEVGMPWADMSTSESYVYYLRTDGKTYGFITAELSLDSGLPEGWLNVTDLVGATYIYSLDEAIDKDSNYVLITKKPRLYIYNVESGSYEQLVTKSELNSNTSGSSSGGGAIVFATELPSTMQPETLYVVTQPELVGAGIWSNGEDLSAMGYTVEVVDALPESPKVCTDINKSFIYIYFLTSDNSGQAYIDEALASVTGLTSGWYPVNDVCTAFGVSYGGIVESMEEMTDEEALYVMPRKADIKNLYHYKDNAVVKLGSFPATSDIKATPNPCMYKVYEVDEFHIVGVDTDENGMAAGVYIDKMEGMDVYIEIVDKLPEVGEPAMNLADMNAYLYYNRIDGSMSGYITEELSAVLEAPAVGWMLFMSSSDLKIIHSLEEATDSSLTYGLFTKKPHLYFYDGEDWIEMSSGFRMAHNPKLETITFVES